MKIAKLSFIAASILIGFTTPPSANAQEALSAEEIQLLKQIIADYESKNSSTLAIDSENRQEITAKAKALFLKGSTSEPFNYSVHQPGESGEDCDRYRGEGRCEIKNVDNTNGTGYEIEIGYRPENSPYFAYGKYRQLHADAENSYTAEEGDGAGIFYWTYEPQQDSCSSSEAPCEVIGRQSLFVDNWSVGAGMDFNPTGYLTLTPKIGITKILASESRYASTGADTALGKNEYIEQSSKYQGWGPQVGLGASLAVAKNLSINFDTTAALSYGDIDSSYFLYNGPSPTEVKSTQSTWVPSMNAAVGVTYDIDLSDSLVLSLNGGYELDYFWGATSIIGSNSYDQEDSGEMMGSKGDILFSGFSLGLGMTYNF